ncbi:MAG: hypothetical protein RLO50_16730 [Azospirillaceae bacterium]
MVEIFGTTQIPSNPNAQSFHIRCDVTNVGDVGVTVRLTNTHGWAIAAGSTVTIGGGWAAQSFALPVELQPGATYFASVVPWTFFYQGCSASVQL